MEESRNATSRSRLAARWPAIFDRPMTSRRSALKALAATTAPVFPRALKMVALSA